MTKHNIQINDTTWTRGKAERQISHYLWTESPGASEAVQPLSSEAQSFIRQFIEGSPQESTFLKAVDICVRWVFIGRKNPTLVFRFANNTSRSISYRSLRDSEEATAKKKELRALRWVTRENRRGKRAEPSHHVDDVAPGTFKWRVRLFKKRWLDDHDAFDVHGDSELQRTWRNFYAMFPLESVTPEENYRRKISSDQRERLYGLVEAAAPQHVKSLNMDRAALWVLWRNNGGWDVAAIGYFADEWLDFPLFMQAEVRAWLGSFA